MRAVRHKSTATHKTWSWLLWKLAILCALSFVGNTAIGQVACSWAFDSVNSLPPWIHQTFPTVSQACHYADWTTSSPSGDQIVTRTYVEGRLIAGSAAQHNRIVSCDEIQSVTGSSDYCSATQECTTTVFKDSFNVSEVRTSTCPKHHV